MSFFFFFDPPLIYCYGLISHHIHHRHLRHALLSGHLLCAIVAKKKQKMGLLVQEVQEHRRCRQNDERVQASLSATDRT